METSPKILPWTSRSGFHEKFGQEFFVLLSLCCFSFLSSKTQHSTSLLMTIVFSMQMQYTLIGILELVKFKDKMYHLSWNAQIKNAFFLGQL